MPEQHILLFLIIAIAMAGFIWGRLRYDVIAGFALLASVYLGVVPPEEAFSGFGHPAVITVGAVLVISQALQSAGLVDWFVKFLAPTRKSTTLQIAAGSGITIGLSAIMNNVGALALMLPVTIRNAARAQRPVSLLLIPLSFASMLGGLITLIGTPPNLIVSAYRAEYTGKPFALLDFAPIGLVVALAGLTYLSTVGWRLLPHNERSNFRNRAQKTLAPFVAEVAVPEGSSLDGRPVRYIEHFCDNEITIMAIIREGGDRFYAPRPITLLRAGDVIIIEGDPAIWEPLCDGKRFAVLGRQDASKISLRSQDVVLADAVVMPGSPLEELSVRGMRLHENYGINLLALSRQREPVRSRLRNIKFEVGDLLLLQGERHTLDHAVENLGCLMLSQRSPIGARRGSRIWLVPAILGVALLAAALNLVTAPIALFSAAGAFILIRAISLHDAYNSIEWPIIVLIGALIPIGQAMKSTGAASLVAESLTTFAGAMPLWAIIGIVMVVSMWLSDLVHNTPTAVLMAPVGISIATTLDVSVDPFLMAIAIGSASAYLTPIGHQSNTLVMGPGGYQFSDYARVGIVLQVIILLVSVPMIILIWPPIVTLHVP